MFASRTSWELEPNRFTRALERLRSSGREVLDLIASNPTQVGLSYDADAIRSALIRDGVLTYHPHPKGLLSAREAVAAYYRQRAPEACAVDPESILLTSSSSQSYSHLFRLLCEPGDEVLVPRPSYPLFEFLAGIEDVRLVSYQLTHEDVWRVDLDSVAAALTPRSRALMVVHPNNPTASYIQEAEAGALSALCAKRGIALIADEVFLDYHHAGPPRRSFARHGEALTFALSGLSKLCCLPQMKLGWLTVHGPAKLASQAMARLEVIADTYLAVGTPVQLAAPGLLESRHEVVAQLRERVQSNLVALDLHLSKQGVVTRLACEGGWYAILRVPAVKTDEELAIELLEKHAVMVHPGHFYDFPREGHLVLSLIATPEAFKTGLGRVLEHLKSW